MRFELLKQPGPAPGCPLHRLRRSPPPASGGGRVVCVPVAGGYVSTEDKCALEWELCRGSIDCAAVNDKCASWDIAVRPQDQRRARSSPPCSSSSRPRGAPPRATIRSRG